MGKRAPYTLAGKLGGEELGYAIILLARVPLVGTLGQSI